MNRDTHTPTHTLNSLHILHKPQRMVHNIFTAFKAKLRAITRQIKESFGATREKT